MPPPAKGRSVVKEPPKAFPIREWSAREFCIQKKEDGGVWGKTLPSILVLGKRYSGKTCAGIDLCFELQDQFDCAVVFSGSDDVSPTFSKIIPDIFVYREITAERIDRILKRQTELSDKYENDPNVNPQLLVIFDDIMNDRNSATEEFLDLFKKGRHYRILVLVLAQYFNGTYQTKNKMHKCARMGEGEGRVVGMCCSPVFGCVSFSCFVATIVFLCPFCQTCLPLRVRIPTTS